MHGQQEVTEHYVDALNKLPVTLNRLKCSQHMDMGNPMGWDRLPHTHAHTNVHLSQYILLYVVMPLTQEECNIFKGCSGCAF